MKSKWGQKSTLKQQKNVFAVTVHSTIPMLPNDLQIDWHLPRINVVGSVYKYMTGSAKTEVQFRFIKTHWVNICAFK